MIRQLWYCAGLTLGCCVSRRNQYFPYLRLRPKHYSLQGNLSVQVWVMIWYNLARRVICCNHSCTFSHVCLQ
jgi:hypothetical protein